eukprot:m.486887 g.486887  ORF g.486887 m.486887 type:complete len:512 (+) comp24656_c0_seq1:371-1906(+)
MGLGRDVAVCLVAVLVTLGTLEVLDNQRRPPSGTLWNLLCRSGWNTESSTTTPQRAGSSCDQAPHHPSPAPPHRHVVDRCEPGSAACLDLRANPDGAAGQPPVSARQGGSSSAVDDNDDTQPHNLLGQCRRHGDSAGPGEGIEDEEDGGGPGCQSQHTATRDPLYYSRSGHKHSVRPDRLTFDVPRYEIGMVTDLDKNSRDRQTFTWRSLLRRAMLHRRAGPPVNTTQPRTAPNTGAPLDPPAFSFDIEFLETTELKTHTSHKNRSMELSELTRFNHLLLGFCDYTGLIFKIVPEDGRVFQRYALADGNGDEPKPFKNEWATVKDGRLWVGSIGKEWITPTGDVLHHNAEWVKTITAHGRIDNFNWAPIYQAMRTATNTTYPGYLWHEAVYFDTRSRQWIVLPRKASFEPYTVKADETKGSNLLLIADEYFSNIQVRRVGEIEPTYGYTTLRKFPGTENLYVALKVAELEDTDVQHTKLCVFDLDGRFYLDNGGCADVSDIKFEGLEFLRP